MHRQKVTARCAKSRQTPIPSLNASQAVLVERDAAAVRALQANRTLLSAQQVEIIRADAMDFLQSDRRRYDVVFIDPPYRLNLLPRILPVLDRILAPGARVFLEADRAPEPPPGFELLKQARTGQAHCLLLKWLQT